MFHRKKIPYYIFAVAAIIIVCMASPFTTISNGESGSCLNIIMSYTKEEMAEQCIMAYDCISTAGSYWLFMLIAVAVSIPSVSCVNNELKNGVYMGIQMRCGRYRYIYLRYVRALISGTVIVVAAVVGFSLVILEFFPLEMSLDNVIIVDGIDYYGAAAFWETVALKILEFAVYGAAMSLFGTFAAYLLPDRLVNLSIVFMAAYFLAEYPINIITSVSVLIIVVLLFLYGIMWRFRSERI